MRRYQMRATTLGRRAHCPATARRHRLRTPSCAANSTRSSSVLVGVRPEKTSQTRGRFDATGLVGPPASSKRTCRRRAPSWGLLGDPVDVMVVFGGEVRRQLAYSLLNFRGRLSANLVEAFGDRPATSVRSRCRFRFRQASRAPAFRRTRWRQARSVPPRAEQSAQAPEIGRCS